VTRIRLLLATALLAALSPILGEAFMAAPASAAATQLPPWPREFQGRPLTRVPLADAERRFLSGFPGDVARFTDGERDVLLRWVTRPSRRLHPADDCYRAWGYTVALPPIRVDRDGVRWRCFSAGKNGTQREICEQVRDAEGAHWTDVSSWYWAATFDHTHGPWLVTTVSN
jgi:hypothetical protein